MACYLKLFVDVRERYQKLSDAEFGRLIRAALTYKAEGVEVKLQGREELMWDGMKLDIDRDNERQKSVNESRADAGRKGAESRWQKDGKNSKCHLPHSKNGYDKDKEEDKEEDKDKNIPPKSPQGDLFERFWAAYPKKKSKGQARRAWDKLKPGSTMVDQMLLAIERAKQSEDWQKDGGQYIPYPATWLNAEGWEDEEPGPDPPLDRPPVVMNWVVPNPDSDNWEDLVP